MCPAVQDYTEKQDMGEKHLDFFILFGDDNDKQSRK